MDYTIDYADIAGIEAAATIFLVILAVYFLLLIFLIVGYVLESLGLYSIAKRRGIHHPWLAWLPVGNLWMWGCISDQYRYVAKGQIKSKRKVLLTLSILLLLVALGSGVNSCILLFREMEGHFVGLTHTFVQLAMAAVTLILTLVSTVFQYLCLHDLYVSCNPENGVLFLILSILFGIVRPFLIFSCRNKDFGMPPRRPVIQEPVYNPSSTWQAEEPPRDA